MVRPNLRGPLALRHAIVRPPGPTFAQGITSAGLGAPDLATALEQHAAYCGALERCGLTVMRLAADDRYPDATFIEDTAVLSEGLTVLTRPGAPSRQGEVQGVMEAFAAFSRNPMTINAPGTLDGGDVCQEGQHFFIGLSHRTNEAGAAQLGEILDAAGFTSENVDIRTSRRLLHLKSGISPLGRGRMLLVEELAGETAFRHYESVIVDSAEEYGANCVDVNGRVLLAGGHPLLEESLRSLGYDTIPLDVSEYRKMDGGLSCLSLRF